MIGMHCRSSQYMMTHHPLAKWKRPFSVSKPLKQPVLTTSLPGSSIMVGVLCIRACIILSLTAGPPSVSHRHGKMPTLFLYANKMVTEQNVATVMAGKVLARIMLTRLLEHLVDLVLPESQCDFGCGCSTIDMIFVDWQLQEKCHEQH